MSTTTREPHPVEAWSELQSPGLRDSARGAALTVLAGAYRATGLLSKGLRTPRVHFLYLHHVFADEEASFRNLLAHVTQRHRVIGYSEAVDRVVRGPIDDSYACFSFDDGLTSCERAARVLEEFDARGCFFVLPSIVGEKNPDRLREFCQRALGAGPFEFLDWKELEGLVARGHEIGSHTNTHSSIAELTPDGMREEIFGSREELVRRVGTVRHFAWPFGGFEHFHPEAARMVFEAGYESCASAVRGCHVTAPARPSELCIRRENTFACWPHSHIDYFMARSALEAGATQNCWPKGWNVENDGGTTCASPS